MNIQKIRLKMVQVIYLLSTIIILISCKNSDSSNHFNEKDKNTSLLKSTSNTVHRNQASASECGIRVNKHYSIKKLVDGDTFWLEDGCEGVKIRLIGIDAPESKNSFGKIKEEPFGKEASTFMDQLLSGKMIKVEFDVDSLDNYGRTLAYCFTEDGIFLNKKMVEEGMAMIMTVPPNVKYQEELYNAQVKAREERKGLWGL